MDLSVKIVLAVAILIFAIILHIFKVITINFVFTEICQNVHSVKNGKVT